MGTGIGTASGGVGQHALASKQKQTQDELDELLARRPSVMAILQAELDDDDDVGGGGGDNFLAPLDDE